MAAITVLNTATTRYVVDDDGKVLAGRERGQVDDRQTRVAAGLASGRLVKVEGPKAPSAKSDSGEAA